MQPAGLESISNRSLLIRIGELSSLTGLPVRTLYRAAAEGRIPGVRRIGRSLYFARPEIKRWLGSAAAGE